MVHEAPDLLEHYPFHTSRWPKVARDPDQADGSDALRISWDLGAVEEADKKRIIRDWCARLPAMQHLRRLSLWSQVTPPVFQAICALSQLESLQIKWSNLKDLGAISRLGRLRHLYIGSSTRVASIEPLRALTELRLLEIENFKLIRDFSPLEALTRLESLSVSGSMWTRQDVGSLEPFARMTWLRALALDTAHLESVRPLAALQQLEVLGLGGRLPMEEYAWLAAKLPNTNCRWFSAFLDVSGSGFLPCTTCGQDAWVMCTGRGKPRLCRHCDAPRLARHVAAFDAAKQAAA